MNKIRLGIISLSRTAEIIRCQRKIVSADGIAGYKSMVNYLCLWI